MPTTTVQDLRDWLAQFDGDVEVQVVEPTGLDNPQEVDLDLSEYANGSARGNWDYHDFTHNQFVNADPAHPCYGRRILTLGDSG